MIRSTIKLISIISITFFLVFSFVGQSLVVGAVDTPAPGTGTTATPKPADTSTPKPATPATKSDGPAIGGLKNCTVDKTTEFSPKQGNDKLRDCLRDIIQLVITIAVLISVASLAGYGIQLMNPMETSGKIQGQIAQRITELAVGGVILGMFGTILATINPATLTTSKVFGENAVETFRKYIGVGQGITKAGVSTGTGATGAGGTTSGGSTDPALKAIYVDNKQIIDPTKLAKVIADKSSPEYKALQALVTKNDKCNDTFSEKNDCKGFTALDKSIVTELAKNQIKSLHTSDLEFPSPVYANYYMDFKKDTTSGLYTATFKQDGKVVEKKFTLKGSGGGQCPVANLVLGSAVKASTEIIKPGCTITIKQ